MRFLRYSSVASSDPRGKLSKENQSWTAVRGIRTDLFRTTMIGEMRPQYITGLKFKYSMGRWGLIAKEQGEGE